MDHIPWKVQSKHKDAPAFHRLREHLKWVALGGRNMSDQEQKRLRKWYDELTELGVVLEYKPDHPPAPGQRVGGWRYVPREDRDEDLIIRVNRAAKMTDEAYELFRVPDRLPE